MAKQYRLTILEDDSHKTLGSVRFTRLGIYLLVGSAAVLSILVIYCLIAFTPVRNTIPGYPDAHSKKVAIENAIKIDSLENTIIRWEIYVDNLSRVLAGEQTLSLDSLVNGNMTRYLSSMSAAELALRDSLLREKVRKEEQFGVSDTKNRAVPIEGMHFFSPIKGVLSSGFDPVKHPFVDITAKPGDIVFAVLDGTVVSTSWSEDGGYGMVIQHTGDIVSSFENCRRLVVAKGDKVRAGSAVAMLGETSSLTQGDFLHFELWYRGEAVDPVKYIGF